MLDIVRIRNNPKEIEDALRKRMDNISLDEVLMWDEEKRKIGAFSPGGAAALAKKQTIEK